GAEGAMETANRIGKRVRVLLDRGGNPGMGELQQQGAARSQENCGLPVDLPGDRSRTEYARERTGRRTTHQVQLALQAFRADDFEWVMFYSRIHSCRLDTQLRGNRKGASMRRYGAGEFADVNRRASKACAPMPARGTRWFAGRRNAAAIGAENEHGRKPPRSVRGRQPVGRRTRS